MRSFGTRGQHFKLRKPYNFSGVVEGPDQVVSYSKFEELSTVRQTFSVQTTFSHAYNHIL